MPLCVPLAVSCQTIVRATISSTKNRLTTMSCRITCGKNGLPVFFWYAYSRRYASRRSRAVRRAIAHPSGSWRCHARSARALPGLARDGCVLALARPRRRGRAEAEDEPHVDEDEREDPARDDQHVQRVEARERL